MQVSKEIKLINANIIDKSQLNKFTNIQIVSAPVTEVKYLDYVILPKENGIENLSLQVFSKFISISPNSVVASATKEQLDNLKTLGVDGMSMINSVLINDTAINMFRQFKKYVVELSTLTYLKDYTKWDKFKLFFLKIFRKKYQKIIKHCHRLLLVYLLLKFHTE